MSLDQNSKSISIDNSEIDQKGDVTSKFRVIDKLRLMNNFIDDFLKISIMKKNNYLKQIHYDRSFEYYKEEFSLRYS